MTDRAEETSGKFKLEEITGERPELTRDELPAQAGSVRKAP